MRRLIERAALILLLLVQVATAEAAADRWLVIPGLTPVEIDRLAGQFELRGTYGDLTLALGDQATADELLRRYPQTLRALEYRPDERVFVVHLEPGEQLNPNARARLLLRRKGMAILGLPSDPSLSIASVLSEHRTGRFHEGIAQVANRRQRPQQSAPMAAEPFDHDPRIQSWVDSVSAANLEADVTSLSTNTRTRQSDTMGGLHAQQWLVDRFEALGLAPSTHSFDDGADNVIVEFPGALEPERVVIIGAHYDSVAFSGTPAPGADDNASGTAALLEIARILVSEEAAFRYTLRLIAFASEEFGLVGSSAYSQRMVDEGVDIVAMLNTDMNSHRRRGDAFDLDMVTSNATAWLTDELIKIANLYVPDLPTVKGPLFAGISDHASFFNDGFPAAFYFEDIDKFSRFIHTFLDTVGRSANDFELSRAIVQAVLAGAAVFAEPTRISLSGSCPGELTVEVTDMTPNASVFIFWSPTEDSYELSGGSCRGTRLGLVGQRLLGVAATDSGGSAELTRHFPAARCGLFLQAMDRSTCAPTHVVHVP